MLIGSNSKYLLKKTQAKARMFEYDVPLEEHIVVEEEAIKLLLIAIGSLNEVSSVVIKSDEVDQVRIDQKLVSDLHFSATFFDSLITSTIDPSEDYNYYYLLGAASYYFCDYVGSSRVMLSFVDEQINVGGGGFEKGVYQILNGSYQFDEIEPLAQLFEREIGLMVKEYFDFFQTGIFPDFQRNLQIYEKVLMEGTNRESFLCGIMVALIKKKTLNSALNLLPRYSLVPSETWKSKILDNNKLAELWPSQRKLGDFGLFQGNSGVVQMPTSSGKTTGIAIMLQSSFITNPGKNALIVAPFRALCKEITRDLVAFFDNDSSVNVEEIFDIPDKTDIEDFVEDERNQVFVLTPEKLLYLLRIDATILNEVSLVVLDEAHLFDDPNRGTRYELLIATLKNFLPEAAQTVLISAVVPNADVINDWINDGTGVVISDNTIKAVEKSIAIGDWLGDRSRLTFVNPENPDVELYYVPRVVEIRELGKFPQERKVRYFPELNLVKREKSKENGNDLSIYYAIKLLHNGSVAVFCGQKTTVGSIVKRVLELEKRNVDISIFADTCINNENLKISKLIEVNLGEDSYYSIGASKGIFPHHADIPTGVKYSIEYAMSEKLISFVVCTSTLAQGVNLPIKYLIVSNIFQAGERMSVRDFHNLIGRTGRAGKHTEGSVILTEPFIYNNRQIWGSMYKWQGYKRLINASNSEPCDSTIIQLVKPVYFRLEGLQAEVPVSFFKIILEKYQHLDEYNNHMGQIRELFVTKYPKQIRQLDNTIDRIESTLNEIENYIASYLSRDDIGFQITPEKIAMETLGYFLANEEEKIKIIEMFTLIQEYIRELPSEDVKKLSQTSIGVFQGKALLNWTREEIDALIRIETDSEIIKSIIPKIVGMTKTTVIKNFVDRFWLKDICELWISGQSYVAILQFCQGNEIQILYRGKPSDIRIEDVVQICDKVFAYENLLPIAAIQTFLSDFEDFNGELLFTLFSKKMKYGLPDVLSIMIYELGFSDRHIAQLMSALLPKGTRTKNEIRIFLRRNKVAFRRVLENYPSYFKSVLEII